jgi:hypothetical protein
MPLVRQDLTGRAEEDDLYSAAPAVGAAADRTESTGASFLFRSVTVSDPALPLAKHAISAVRCLGCSCGRWAGVACIAGFCVSVAGSVRGGRRAVQARRGLGVPGKSRQDMTRGLSSASCGSRLCGARIWSVPPRLPGSSVMVIPPHHRSACHGPASLPHGTFGPCAQAMRRTGLACALRNCPVAGMTRPPVSAPYWAPDPAPSCGPGRRGWPGERRCDRIAG